MTSDRLVDLVIAELPQLRDQPEWEEHGEVMQHRALSDFAYWVLGPHLRRVVDAGDRKELLQVLSVLETLASHPQGEAAVATLCEYSIFRRKYSGVVLPLELMGPRSRSLIDDLQATWAPWEPLIEVLFPFFDEVIERVRSEYSGLKCGRTASVRLGGTLFHAYASFMYDPAGQRHEDLLLSLHVTDRLVMYEVERGTGHPLVGNPEPASLPEEGSPDFLPALLDYAGSAVSFTWRHLPAILPLLREPYNVGD